MPLHTQHGQSKNDSGRCTAYRIADRILLLDQGRLVEAGTHDELLVAQGPYAELYGLQAAWYRGAPSVLIWPPDPPPGSDSRRTGVRHCSALVLDRGVAGFTRVPPAATRR